MNYTERDDRGPVRNGQPGGDRQIDDAWNRRFVQDLDDGTFAVIDVDFYTAELDGRTILERQTEYTLCTDPKAPGDSELWADVRHVEVEFSGVPTDDDAHRACLAVSADEFDWDGQPFH